MAKRAPPRDLRVSSTMAMSRKIQAILPTRLTNEFEAEACESSRIISVLGNHCAGLYQGQYLHFLIYEAERIRPSIEFDGKDKTQAPPEEGYLIKQGPKRNSKPQRNSWQRYHLPALKEISEESNPKPEEHKYLRGAYLAWYHGVKFDIFFYDPSVLDITWDGRENINRSQDFDKAVGVFPVHGFQILPREQLNLWRIRPVWIRFSFSLLATDSVRILPRTEPSASVQPKVHRRLDVEQRTGGLARQSAPVETGSALEPNNLTGDARQVAKMPAKYLSESVEPGAAAKIVIRRNTSNEQLEGLALKMHKVERRAFSTNERSREGVPSEQLVVKAISPSVHDSSLFSDSSETSHRSCGGIYIRSSSFIDTVSQVAPCGCCQIRSETHSGDVNHAIAMNQISASLVQERMNSRRATITIEMPVTQQPGRSEPVSAISEGHEATHFRRSDVALSPGASDVLATLEPVTPKDPNSTPSMPSREKTTPEQPNRSERQLQSPISKSLLDAQSQAQEMTSQPSTSTGVIFEKTKCSEAMVIDFEREHASDSRVEVDEVQALSDLASAPISDPTNVANPEQASKSEGEVSPSKLRLLLEGKTAQAMESQPHTSAGIVQDKAKECSESVIKDVRQAHASVISMEEDKMQKSPNDSQVSLSGWTKEELQSVKPATRSLRSISASKAESPIKAKELKSKPLTRSSVQKTPVSQQSTSKSESLRRPVLISQATSSSGRSESDPQTDRIDTADETRSSKISSESSKAQEDSDTRATTRITRQTPRKTPRKPPKETKSEKIEDSVAEGASGTISSAVDSESRTQRRGSVDKGKKPVTRGTPKKATQSKAVEVEGASGKDVPGKRGKEMGTTQRTPRKTSESDATPLRKSTRKK